MQTGPLVGSGRTADVYAIDDERVLRRYRDGYGGAAAEAVVMTYVLSHGYPVPKVRAGTVADAELVMERLSGPTMLEALAGGVLTAEVAGATLARLLRELHALPARVSDDPGERVLHLDLHPENVLLTRRGPVVIDWANAEEGQPALDWGMSAIILAQVAVSAEPRAQMAHEVLVALLADCEDPAALTDANSGGLPQAVERRAANPTMRRREVELLDEAQTLIREVLARLGR
ncbi:phosphotransferase [Streptomyces sp. NPDC002577]